MAGGEGGGEGGGGTKRGVLERGRRVLGGHSRYDLRLKVEGDTCVDFQHSVEEGGSALGEALKKALGNKGGIAR